MKEKNKFIIKIAIIVILIIILSLVVKFLLFSNNSNTANLNNSNYQSNSNDTVDFTETSSSVEISDIKSENYSSFTAKINLSTMEVEEGTGVSIKNNVITISKEGTYYITNTSTDASIEIDASDNAKIVLVFDNASITSKNTPAINVKKAKSVTINLIENTTNTIKTTGEYSKLDSDGEPDGAIFSKSDLYITGKGKLTIETDYKDGIVSKDGLAIVDATINIISEDDGIRGKDYTSINNANITINSNGDGIKSTNDSDSSLGYIVIKDSTINITSNADGIQAKTIVNITESNINIKTTGEISKNNTQSDTSDTTSSKGIKSGKEITINSGNFTINSTDDSIHSNNYIIINGGTFNISTNDDGIHADTNILINNADLTINKSYEGIEAKYIKINDGTIKVYASDDGINVSGGNSNQFGGNIGSSSSGEVNENARQLIINGGNIYVKSDGDGLDSNGSIVLNGGYTLIVGTTSNGDSALDYDDIFNVNGGTLIYYGSTGMWQNPSSSSKEYSLCFNASGNNGDNIVLKDTDGNTIVSFTTESSYQAITIASENIKNNETYTLYINGNENSSQTVSSIVTSNLTTSGMNNGGMRGKMNR